MYIPKHFAAETHAALEALGSAAAVELVTLTSNGLVASTVPLLYVADPNGETLGTLQGHLARANSQWRDTITTTDALVIATPASAYVSPSAYPSKAVDGRVVPTLNYTTVHARGSFIAHDDPEWTRELVTKLTDFRETLHANERPNNEVTGRAWSIHDAPEDYIATMLKAIVGFEIVITSVIGKDKLSQNKSNEDRHGVIRDLSQGTVSEQTIASAMQQALVE
jgi:transcriptional regulator